MTVNRFQEDGEVIQEAETIMTCGRRERSHSTCVDELSHTETQPGQDVVPQKTHLDQVISNQPHNFDAGERGTREHQDVKSVWEQNNLSKPQNSASCGSNPRNKSSYLVKNLSSQESVSNCAGSHGSYVSLKSYIRRRSCSEIHGTEQSNRVHGRGVKMPELTPVSVEKLRSQSEVVGRRTERDTHGISDSPAFFSSDFGEWRMLDLDQNTFELEESRRISLLRAASRRYQEISEPQFTCTIL